MSRSAHPHRGPTNSHVDDALRVARLLSPETDASQFAEGLEALVHCGGLSRLLFERPHHRVGPILAARMHALDVRPSSRALRAAASALDRAAARCELRNRLLRAQLAELLDLLADHSIRPCLVKGAVSLADAPPPGILPAAQRWMEDLDVVVEPEAYRAARELVAHRGWLCVSGDEERPFDVNAPAPVDVHAGTPRSAAAGFLGSEAFFDRAVPVAVAGREATALRPADAVQFRLVHNVIRQHLFIDFPLVDLCEMAGVISACGDGIDWARLRGVGLRNEVSRVFDAILLRLREEFGAPVPDDAIPPIERGAAERTRRRLEQLAPVPDCLYCAACRSVLVSATPGRSVDRVNRAGSVLLLDPLREVRGGGFLAAVLLAARMLFLHVLVEGWRRLRD